MTQEEFESLISTLEQENKQLHARNKRLQETIDKVWELIEANK